MAKQLSVCRECNAHKAAVFFVFVYFYRLFSANAFWKSSGTGARKRRVFCDGVAEFQLKRVERLPADPVKNRMIKEISGERTADVFHMDTDLMCTSRVQMKFHKRIAVTDSKAFIMSYRSFSMLPVYFSGDNGVIHSCNGRGNGSSFRWNSICKSQVSAADLALFHLSRQKCAT